MGLLGVRQVAQREKRLRFTALLHHLSIAQLRASYIALKRDAAPGVDGLTWHEYQHDLDHRLATLHERVHRGSFRALPPKRVYIPKASGGQRPVGIAALEDKIVQHAVSTVMAAVYEADFLGFSYGFRPGRSPHDALDALWVGLMQRRVNWVLDADIQGFFDTLDHEWLMRFVAHRIADPRILQLVGMPARRKRLSSGRLDLLPSGARPGFPARRLQLRLDDVRYATDDPPMGLPPHSRLPAEAVGPIGYLPAAGSPDPRDLPAEIVRRGPR